MKQRDRETRERLLTAAARLFADRGFKKVTVRDICRAARANVAAVNYHFGDKLGLYREVLQRRSTRCGRRPMPRARPGAGQPAEEQLRRYIRVSLHRVVGPQRHAWIPRLIYREMADPTPALDALVEQGIRPRIDYLSASSPRCSAVRSTTSVSCAAWPASRRSGCCSAQSRSRRACGRSSSCGTTQPRRRRRAHRGVLARRHPGGGAGARL